MIKFGFENYETEFPNWSKHHKVLSVLVKRVYDDGEIVESEDDQIKDILLRNEDKLKSKHVSLYNRESGKRRTATNYFLPLNNLEFNDGHLSYYSSGDYNTKQETHVRIKFMIEDNLFIIDHNYQSYGNYTPSFKSYYIDGIDMIGDILDELVENGSKIEEYGIEQGDNDDYLIAVANEVHCPDSFEISKRELLESLIGIEIYKFNMDTIDK